MKELTRNCSQALRVYDSSGTSIALKALGGGLGVKTGLYAVKECRPVLTPGFSNKGQNGRQVKNDGEPMFTLTSGDSHGIYDGYRIRRLTPLECERLQSFPDYWTATGIDDSGRETEITDSNRYRCLGNAVTVNVVEDIARRLVCQLK